MYYKIAIKKEKKVYKTMMYKLTPNQRSTYLNEEA